MWGQAGQVCHDRHLIDDSHGGQIQRVSRYRAPMPRSTWSPIHSGRAAVATLLLSAVIALAGCGTGENLPASVPGSLPGSLPGSFAGLSAWHASAGGHHPTRDQRATGNDAATSDHATADNHTAARDDAATGNHATARDHATTHNHTATGHDAAARHHATTRHHAATGHHHPLQRCLHDVGRRLDRSH